MEGMDTDLFSRTTRLLLEGSMICESTFPQEYGCLQLKSERELVSDYLNRIDRQVRSSTDGKVFFCAYSNPNEPGAKVVIRRLFKQVATDISALVSWLRLVRDCHPTGRPIEAGMIINGSELLAAIEASPVHSDKLSELTKHQMFKSTATDGKGRIRNVLARLEKDGYLITIDTTGSKYKATGRWSFVYDTMAFIRSNENLPLEGDAEDAPQGALF
ncbi:MAG: hypothetical protein ACJAWL_000885 [Motiliproteus sp.]|jgi:hypothetical protein